MHISTRLTATRSYVYTLGAQEVTTNDMYRLPAPAINYSPCQTLREVIAGDRE